jgi:dienelactone hydrolase
MKRRKGKIVAGISLLLLFVMALGGYLYITDDYPASENALQLLHSADNITYQKEQDAYFLYPEGGVPADTSAVETGIIFYPGGKVEETAYLPLLDGLAKEEYLCVCMHMPLQLAVLDVNGADQVIDAYPDVENWYIMGHSLGGAMAASYAGEKGDKVEGLILLGAYAANDLKESNIQVLSIFGSEDKVLNRDKYQKSLANLPEGYEELEIEGGNHAQFGDYGVQNGDGEAKISRAEQQAQTREGILRFLR